MPSWVDNIEFVEAKNLTDKELRVVLEKLLERMNLRIICDKGQSCNPAKGTKHSMDRWRSIGFFDLTSLDE